MKRVVLLGASNVTLGFGVITRLLRAGFEGPLDVRGVFGHGRSFGSWSTLAGRSLPPIESCGLWRSLEGPSCPTYAMLTDVGNDLMYGQRPETIAAWVDLCLKRLSDNSAATIVIRLPIERIERLSAMRYHATRASFFPLHRPIAWPEMLRRAYELDDRVSEAATRAGAIIVVPRLDWYGLDPIHIRWTRRAMAWSSILSAWEDFRDPGAGRTGKPLSLIGRFPEQYRLLGQERFAAQPVTQKHDMTLSLF